MTVENGSYIVNGMTLRLKDSNRGFHEGEQLAQYELERYGKSRFFSLAYVRGDEQRVLSSNLDAIASLQELAAAAPEQRQGYGEAYATKTGKCWRCGRKLTDPSSVAGGVGPVCVTKGAA